MNNKEKLEKEKQKKEKLEKEKVLKLDKEKLKRKREREKLLRNEDPNEKLERENVEGENFKNMIEDLKLEKIIEFYKERIAKEIDKDNVDIRGNIYLLEDFLRDIREYKYVQIKKCHYNFAIICLRRLENIR